MQTDLVEAARRFSATHQKLRDIASELAPIEANYLSDTGSGSAGMELDGILGDYEQKTAERQKCVETLRSIRAEIGDNALIAALGQLDESAATIRYIRKTKKKRGRLFGLQR